MENRRLTREKETLGKMISLYCRKTHAPGKDCLCPGCEALKEYALVKILRCPFGADKPTCAQCSIHCYRPEKREEIRQVMRYTGPRMLVHHPILTILHLIDGFRYRQA